MKKYWPQMVRAAPPGPADPRTAAAAGVPQRSGLSVQPPAGVRFIPGEAVLLLVVALPKMSAHQRRTAAVYAVEDQIARPLEEVHVALGPELAPNRWLVGVVARTALPLGPTTAHRILPDTLAVPVPPDGHWAVHEAAGRILIRLPDGTGFVTRPQALALLHQIADTPAITLHGGHIGLEHTRAALPAMEVPAGFDLTDRRGATLALPQGLRRVMAIAALAALGHLAILSADIISLSRQQASLAVQLRAAAGATPDQNIDDLVARILTPQSATRQSGFLPLLAATFAALGQREDGVSLRDLRYAAAADSLTLTLQAPDLGTLQQSGTDLAAARLGVASGPATNANGTAEQVLTVQRPPP